MANSNYKIVYPNGDIPRLYAKESYFFGIFYTWVYIAAIYDSPNNKDKFYAEVERRIKDYEEARKPDIVEYL